SRAVPCAASVLEGVPRCVIQATFDVSLNGPLVRKPAFGPCARAKLNWVQQLFEVLKRSVYGLSGSEPIRDGIKIRLEHRLKDVLHRGLDYPVIHSGNPQGTKLPWLPRLRDEYSTCRFRPKRLGAQLLA